MVQPFKLPPFHDRALLELALTHRSYVNEHPEVQAHNERLEFLGDAVLNFISGNFLYKRFPYKAEGELTPLRSALVDEQQLAKFAEMLELGPLMKLGKGAEREGGRQNANLLSSTFEAIVGAYFLDTNSVLLPFKLLLSLYLKRIAKTNRFPTSISKVSFKLGHWQPLVKILNTKSRVKQAQIMPKNLMRSFE